MLSLSVSCLGFWQFFLAIFFFLTSANFENATLTSLSGAMDTGDGERSSWSSCSSNGADSAAAAVVVVVIVVVIVVVDDDDDVDFGFAVGADAGFAVESFSANASRFVGAENAAAVFAVEVG